jgi:hypothetical protein
MSLVETSHGAAMAELSSMMVAMASSLEREEMGREKLTGGGRWLAALRGGGGAMGGGCMRRGFGPAAAPFLCTCSVE